MEDNNFQEFVKENSKKNQKSLDFDEAQSSRRKEFVTKPILK